jgi:hypothetical protein
MSAKPAPKKMTSLPQTKPADEIKPYVTGCADAVNSRPKNLTRLSNAQLQEVSWGHSQKLHRKNLKLNKRSLLHDKKKPLRPLNLLRGSQLRDSRS